METFHWWFRGRSKILPALIRPYARGPSRILDVGSCGGGVTQALSEFGHVTACDVDIRCAVAVQRRSGIDFVYGRAEALPFPDASFDLVTAFDVLEHVDDDTLVLREMRRLLAKDGAIAVTVPAYQWLWGRQDEVSNHRRRYGARLLRERMVSAGFRIQRLTFFNTLLFPAAAGIRLFRRVFPSGRAAGSSVQSDFSMTGPGRFNDVLASVFGAERFSLRYVDFPVGVSLFATATPDRP